MIQRKQTLFLLQLVLLSLVLMFVPCAKMLANNHFTDVFLLPVNQTDFHSTMGHWAAIGMNFLILVLSLITIFLYKKRELQKRISYFIAFLWVALSLMIAFCPFIASDNTPVSVTVNYYTVIIGVLGTMGAVLAARFIQRDIDLLKSADRIR